MAYDEDLARRIRSALSSEPAIEERRMFGGIAFLRLGNMFVGVVGETLMARIGAANEAEALRRPHVRPMDFTGRPLKGFVYVDPLGIEDDASLRAWIERALSFVAGLPPKPLKKPNRAAKSESSSRAAPSSARRQPKRRGRA
jgi:TfoX/Sxy family transcriptional regulator of competence genes